MILVLGALAQDPTVTLAWSHGVGRVDVRPPAGWHVAPDAPASIHLTSNENVSVAIAAVGDPSPSRFPIGPGRIEVAFAICEDAAGACRPVSFQGTVTPQARGSLALDPVHPPAPVTGTSGASKVYDFAAVWCPPCNLMAAEVLHDPAHAALVAPWSVERVDVDLPASWPLKDRYAVGGYPTLVAVDAAGNEVARLVGYPGEPATVAWFSALADVTPLHQLETAALAGPAASSAARRLAEAEKPEAARRLFPVATDGVDLRVARLLVEKDTDAAAWLLAHGTASDRPESWLYAAVDADPGAWETALPLVLSLPPADAADIYDLLAAHVGGEAGDALRAAAFTLVTGTLTGDPEHDKAQVGFLAELEADMGRVDAALARCAEWSRRYPAEFTYDFAAARILVDKGRFAEAEPLARTAAARAWGDQKLRAAMTLAKALDGEGRNADALAILDAALIEVPAPPAGVEVRTTRYRKQVTELRASLTKP